MFHRTVIIVKSLGKIARHDEKSIIQTSVLFDRLTKDSHLQEQNATFTFKMPVHLLLLTDGKSSSSPRWKLENNVSFRIN